MKKIFKMRCHSGVLRNNRFRPPKNLNLLYSDVDVNYFVEFLKGHQAEIWNIKLVSNPCIIPATYININQDHLQEVHHQGNQEKKVALHHNCWISMRNVERRRSLGTYFWKFKYLDHFTHTRARARVRTPQAEYSSSGHTCAHLNCARFR